LLAIALAGLVVACVCFGRGPGGWVCWSVALGLLGIWGAYSVQRAMLARRRIEDRLRSVFPALGSELSTLVAAALAIKQHQEERALYMLGKLGIRSRNPNVLSARRWLAALARVSWLAKQHPGRPLSAYHRFPQLHALVFSADPVRVPLQREALSRELAEATPADLDALACEYVALLDVLCDSMNDRRLPFAAEAPELLAFTTNRAWLWQAGPRCAAWWRRTRPVYVRGGGALLVALRLVQREAYGATAQLLEGLARDGMLSAETETLRRATGFLALLTNPNWRITSGDIQQYFTRGFYVLAAEMGVLRYPTAGLPEVVNCCQRGRSLREGKRRLIHDALALWDVLGDELGPTLAVLLKRLLEERGRRCPVRLGYWRKRWMVREREFERSVGLVMDGIVAAAAQRLPEAARLFEEVARLEPAWSLPLVNLVQVKVAMGQRDEARSLAALVERRFPREGHALISLGRLFATILDDTAEAERLFAKAMALIEPPTEAMLCLGEIKLLDGSYMEAQAYFEHARQSDTSLPDARLGLARTYMETRNYKLAIEHLQEVAEMGLAEARDLAHYLLYRCHREMGEDRRAFAYLDKVPSRFFKEPELLDDIATHLESEKQYKKAREYAERAMILRANKPQVFEDGEATGV
jgi:tetratricopeptide (TPR) repeat protein